MKTNKKSYRKFKLIFAGFAVLIFTLTRMKFIINALVLVSKLGLLLFTCDRVSGITENNKKNYS
jgi:hypothetical protein